MAQSTGKINSNQIKSFCIIFPDSCAMLNYIFNEEEFRPKIDYLRKTIAKGVPCELLPKVNNEILKKLTVATTDFIQILKQCQSNIQQRTKNSLDRILITKETAEILELAFSRVFSMLARNYYKTAGEKNIKIRRARVVETAVMLAFAEALEKTVKITLKDFFDQVEDDFKDKYTEFCDKQALFMKELNAIPLTKEDCLETTQELNNVLVEACEIQNKDDVELLSQAVGRIYKKDKWGAVVTTDYSDMIRNRNAIDYTTQLIVSDPLYFVYRLDKKIKCALHPKEVAWKTKVNWNKFIKKPPNIGVV